MSWLRSSTRSNRSRKAGANERSLLISPGANPHSTVSHRSARAELLIAFAIFFSLILALKFRVLNQPPVWDGAMSVFPAANTLADHNFDLPYLLDQPGFRSAGPNTHSLSPVTWLTVVTIKLIGPSHALLPVLHLIHFAIAAAAMAGLFQFARPLGVRLAGLTSLTALATPLVLTQAGYLYLEFPMLAATVYASTAWVRRDVRRALLWSTLAVLIKGSGIIVPFALAGVALFDPRRDRRDLRSGLLLLVVPAAVLSVLLALTSEFHAGVAGVWYPGYVSLMLMYLVRIPDVVILLIVYCLFTLLLTPWRERTSTGQLDEDERSALLITAFLVVTFFGFYLAVPLVEGAVVVNPRYYVQIVPFVFFGIVAAVRQRYTERTIAVVLLLVLVWFAANRDGTFYPDNSINNFGLIERSGAYADLLGLQLAEMRVLEELPDSVPVFFDQSTHLRFKYPLMGYAEGPLPNGRYVLHDERAKGGRLEVLPDEFYMMYEYPWMGGEIFRSILEQANANPAVEVSVAEISSGQFRSQLIRVEKPAAP